MRVTKRSRSFMLVLFVLIFTFVALSTSQAESIFKSIQVNYSTVKKIVINNQDKTPPASQQPFVYEGTTYVPLRYISDSLNKEVRWDDATGTIYINDQAEIAQNNGWAIADDFTGSLDTNWNVNKQTGNWTFNKLHDAIFTNDQTAYLPLKQKGKLPNKFTVDMQVAVNRDTGKAGIYLSEVDGEKPTRISLSSNGVSSEFNDMHKSYNKDIKEAKFYNLQIRVDGHDVDVYLDGNKAFSVEAPAWYDLNYMGLYTSYDGVINSFKLTVDQ